MVTVDFELPDTMQQRVCEIAEAKGWSMEEAIRHACELLVMVHSQTQPEKKPSTRQED